MSSDLAAFRKTGATASISATTSTGNVAIPGHLGSIAVHNTGTVWVYFATGIGSGTTAAVTDYWLAPSSTQCLTIPVNHTYAAAATVSSTATIGITPGVGL
jgi:Tfp pilus assembly ATPase PilU